MSLEEFTNSLRLFAQYKCHHLNWNILKSNNYQAALYMNQYFGIDTYRAFMQQIFNINIQAFKKKRQIRVAFVVCIDTTWACDLLYQYFKDDKRFKPFVIVVPLDGSVREYQTAVTYYKNKGYSIQSCTDNYQELLFKDKKYKADIMIHSNPFLFTDNSSLRNMPLNMLHIFIPYSFWLDKSSNDFYSNPLSQCCWKFFCPSAEHKREGSKLCSIGRQNMFYLGYPKMDTFYQTSISSCNLWKCVSNNTAKPVKIIYAPGLPFVKEHSHADFSTFSINYMKIYNYAKEHLDTTTWIYKPHPFLRRNSVLTNIFYSEVAYDRYEHMWSELPNATVVSGGDYYDLFRTSDGMILDSKSFVSGYQYVHKPLLFLMKENKGWDSFNSYGKKLMHILYKANGNDIEAIDKFIQEVLIAKNDPMAKIRQTFFNKYLDYYHTNHKQLASKLIFNEIINSIFSS